MGHRPSWRGKVLPGSNLAALRRSPASREHAAWYRLDDTDADPVSFFHHLKRALGQVPDAPVDLLEDPEPCCIGNGPGQRVVLENILDRQRLHADRLVLVG